MINLENITEDEPYVCFRDLYYNAITYSQKNIEAAAISTVSIDKKPSSRFVNIKYVNDKFIFFSNYNSQKGNDLDNNNNASLLFFWNAINVQIRIEGSVHKTTSVFSDKHFDSRTREKNITSIISRQSSKVRNYEDLVEKYNLAAKDFSHKEINRPDHWGGYELDPKSFEFWYGSESRLNKRKKFIKSSNKWNYFYLES